MDQRKIETFSISNPKYGQQQIENTYENLEILKKEGWDKITEIYQSTQEKENLRNIENEQRQAARMKMLELFDESIPAEMKELEHKIKELMDIEQADELQQQFEKFKERCSDILKKKTNIIKEFSKELEFKDQLYVESIKNFTTDIDKMIILMRDQFILLRESMLTQLDVVEQKFLEDRKSIIKDQYIPYVRELISQLESVESKKERELTTLQDTLEAQAEEAAKKAEMEFINKVILMENHLNFIKEKIEDFTYDIKILFEKLEYRVKVREEKIGEAEEKKKKFEAQDKDLCDEINESIAKYKHNDLENRIKNSQLKNELMKMTESFDQLKDKFQHFEKYDHLRFKHVYEMKSKEAKELALKVALADRTIKSQQLGFENVPNDNPKGFSLEELQKDSEVEEHEIEEEKENDEDKIFRQNVLSRIPTERVKQVFLYIIQEAEFLVEMEIINACEGMKEEEKLNKYVESICKALNIRNEQELSQLLNLFDSYNLADHEDYRHTEEDVENSVEKGDDSPIDSRIKEKGSRLMIDPDKVLDILKEFYNEKKKKAKDQMTGMARSNDFSGEDNEDVKQERMKYLSEIYWDKLGNIISTKTFNVWKALDKALTKYHEILSERKRLVEETKELTEKNKELKSLLNHYKDSDANKELRVPPSHTIKSEMFEFAMGTQNY